MGSSFRSRWASRRWFFQGLTAGRSGAGRRSIRATNVLYVNANEMAWTGGLVAATHGGRRGRAGLSGAVRGVPRAGSGRDRRRHFRRSLDVGERLTVEKITDAIRQGTGRMPGFPNIDDAKLAALLDYLRADGKPETKELVPTGEYAHEDYTFTGYRKFLDPDGYPAIAPPWGTLNAIDLKTGKYLWKIPLGEYPELARNGMKNTGSENYGGPIVTAGGTGVYRGDGLRPQVQGVRQRQRKAAVGDGAAICGSGDAFDLHDRWATVCGDCGERGA